MIEKYYASHIKNRLDAAAINVRKPSVQRKLQKSKKAQEDPACLNNRLAIWLQSL